MTETTTVYAPVPKAKDPKTDVHQPKAKDSRAVAQWRERMKSNEAKALYKDRAATAECVNALARNRGLNRLLVRGLKRVKGVALLFALAHNLMRAATLALELVGLGTGTSIVRQWRGNRGQRAEKGVDLAERLARTYITHISAQAGAGRPVSPIVAQKRKIHSL